MSKTLAVTFLRCETLVFGFVSFVVSAHRPVWVCRKTSRGIALPWSSSPLTPIVVVCLAVLPVCVCLFVLQGYFADIYFFVAQNSIMICIPQKIHPRF